MRHILTLLTVAVIFLTFGCDDNKGNASSSSGGKSDSGQMTSNAESQVLRLKISQLTNEINALRSENEILKKERNDARAEARARYITLSIIAYTALALGVILIAGFILLVTRNTSKHTPIKTKKDLHCPLCGWEYAPGETVCKNCNTHF